MHPLLEKSRSYSVSNPDLSPSGAEYDIEAGGWISTTTGKLVVNEDDEPDPPETKKNDVETGEDQKGR